MDPHLDREGVVIGAAAEWLLLERLLGRPHPGWESEIDSLAGEVKDALLRAATEEARGASEETYLACLGPGGVASPREVAYLGFEDLGQVVSDVRAFYDAFHYRPRTEDTPDHVGVEAGFVGFLHLKEAYALSCGDAEGAATTSQARRRFEDEHLRRIAGPLSRRLEGSIAPHLATAARAIAARIGEASAPLPIADDPDPDDGVGCALGD